MAVEESTGPVASRDLKIGDFTEAQIGRHLLIMHQAGLIMGGAYTPAVTDGPMWLEVELTWDGHEFLAAAKDEKTWNKVKAAVLARTGGLMFEVLKGSLAAWGIEKVKHFLH